ncbi:Tad domain-containing protein [Arthrobacter sp. Marseille-P9274]|uniref:Tad domain-containing protein n=1 Tax=Arthrobacter sp. Marseille-P9274 TaxID=2866572 RepID=UPI0021C8EF53|nr:Tad domain-containing protein [Arthrobacter sp. Marseille-P9274]
MKRVKDEQGATAVLVSILLVVLLGFAALVVDMGRLYSEKAQLQNAADAVALSLAKSCADKPSGVACTTPAAHALALAGANLDDGTVRIIEADTSIKNRVKVTTGTRDEAGRDSLPYLLAPILGITDTDVRASAAVAFGGISAGPAAFPLAFSECQFTLTGGIQLVASKGVTMPGCTSSSGNLIPGGFGYLKSSDSTKCDVYAQASATIGVPSATGNDEPSVCKALLEQWMATLQQTGSEVIVLLPVFHKTEGTGNGGQYFIKQFAAFSVMGWKFTGGNWNASQPTKDPYVYKNSEFTGQKCTGDCRGIIGKFIRFATLDEDFKLGGTSELGASLIYFTE